MNSETSNEERIPSAPSKTVVVVSEETVAVMNSEIGNEVISVPLIADKISSLNIKSLLNNRVISLHKAGPKSGSLKALEMVSVIKPELNKALTNGANEAQSKLKTPVKVDPIFEKLHVKLKQHYLQIFDQ